MHQTARPQRKLSVSSDLAPLLVQSANSTNQTNPIISSISLLTTSKDKFRPFENLKDGFTCKRRHSGLQSLTRPESLITSQGWSAKGPAPRGAGVPGGEGTGLQGQGFRSHPGCSLEAVKDAPHPPGKEVTLGRRVPGGDLRRNISKEKERVWGFLEAGRQGSRDGGWGVWISGKARARSSMGTRAPSAGTGTPASARRAGLLLGRPSRGPGSLPAARGGPGPTAPNQSSRETVAHRPPHHALGPPALPRPVVRGACNPHSRGIGLGQSLPRPFNPTRSPVPSAAGPQAAAAGPGGSGTSPQRPPGAGLLPTLSGDTSQPVPPVGCAQLLSALNTQNPKSNLFVAIRESSLTQGCPLSAFSGSACPEGATGRSRWGAPGGPSR